MLFYVNEVEMGRLDTVSSPVSEISKYFQPSSMSSSVSVSMSMSTSTSMSRAANSQHGRCPSNNASRDSSSSLMAEVETPKMNIVKSFSSAHLDHSSLHYYNKLSIISIAFIF